MLAARRAVRHLILVIILWCGAQCVALATYRERQPSLRNKLPILTPLDPSMTWQCDNKHAFCLSISMSSCLLNYLIEEENEVKWEKIRMI